MNMLLHLLKLLKKKVASYTLAREKVQLTKTNIEKIFDKFIDSDAATNVESAESDKWDKFKIVKWFLKNYEVFINENKDISKEEKGSLISFYTNAERRTTVRQVFATKTKQRKDFDLDFTDRSFLPDVDASPYESFDKLQYALFKFQFEKLNKIESHFQLLIEMTVQSS